MKSLVIDKATLRITERDRTYMASEESPIWVREVLGVLGIVNLAGVEHLVVLTAKGEVCRMPHSWQPSPSQCSVIYEV